MFFVFNNIFIHFNKCIYIFTFIIIFKISMYTLCLKILVNFILYVHIIMVLSQIFTVFTKVLNFNYINWLKYTFILKRCLKYN